MHIRRLPDEVVAQIKSSTAIISLTGVVLELLKNALDAKASTIEAAVDFTRGACSVDDNGCGIPPEDFARDGCLGQLYCTSKHDSDDTPFGRHGTFLASLSALSLLSIISRHRDYRSQHAVSFHHAKLLERQSPSLSPVPLIEPTHGTRVAVRNLFGNMPVRVKYRAVLTEQKRHNDRLWERLRYDVTGLLLAWEDPVKMKVRDSNNKVVFRLETRGRDQGEALQHRKPAMYRRSSRLSNSLSVLSQAGYISVADWPSWVPVSATTSAIVVKGALSLTPAPTKGVQFVNLGLQPLSAESEYNVLYTHMNDLFMNSAFGVDDDSMDAASGAQQLANGRKGVDRYPMFYLQVLSKRGSRQSHFVDRLVDDENNLQAIIDVLSAMITQWLAAHHFRPRALGRKTRPHSPRPKSSRSSGEFQRSSLDSRSTNSTVLPENKRTVQSLKSDSEPMSNQHIEISGSGSAKRGKAFAEWSRVKSGKSDFHGHALLFSKKPSQSHSVQTDDGVDTVALSPEIIATIDSISQDETVEVEFPVQSGTLPTEHDVAVTTHGSDDDTAAWTDPVTRKIFKLNARNGCQVPQKEPPNSPEPTSTEKSIHEFKSRPSIRLKSRSTPPQNTPWLNELLSQWENPVFETCQKKVQTGLEFFQGVQTNQHHLSCHHHSTDFHTFAGGSTAATSNRLQRDDLREAKIIAQVDKKFILVKMPPTKAAADNTSTESMSMLVLIDQHAADERVQVEQLFEDLCLPAIDTGEMPSSQSTTGHKAHVASVPLSPALKFIISRQESKHFISFASNLAAWGILYDATQPCQSETKATTTEEQIHLKITHLPPVISARCTADPQLLINLLRSTIWKYAQDPPLTTSSSTSSDWVVKLATCPPGLVDLVNSRACRSAIMFNDVLSLEECKDLVHKLAKCRFPFVCAHGRPSLVPLLDLGKKGVVDGGKTNELKMENGSEGFVEKWKQWKEK